MDDRDILLIEQRRRTLLVRIFVVCAIASLGLVGTQFYFGVFKQPNLQLAKATIEEDPNALLKAKDTDSDGISDYDEANLYGTSPYLADSDSDGVNDRTELMNGTDPNCPQGKSCGAVTELKDTLTASDVGAKDPGAMPSTSLSALDQLINMTPTQVRDLMKKNGVADSVISKLDDAQIMSAYKSALDKSGIKPGTATPTDIIPKNPTPAEIRDMLVKNGMAATDAAKLSDDDLTKLYQDTLQKATSSQPKQ